MLDLGLFSHFYFFSYWFITIVWWVLTKVFGFFPCGYVWSCRWVYVWVFVLDFYFWINLWVIMSSCYRWKHYEKLISLLLDVLEALSGVGIHNFEICKKTKLMYPNLCWNKLGIRCWNNQFSILNTPIYARAIDFKPTMQKPKHAQREDSDLPLAKVKRAKFSH